MIEGDEVKIAGMARNTSGEARDVALEVRASGGLNGEPTIEKINGAWAGAYANRRVPQLVMGGDGVDATDVATTDFAQMMQLLVAGQLGLDLSVPRGAEAPAR